MDNNALLNAQEYVAKTPKSQALYRRAQEVFPSGVTHDVRYLQPHPLSISRADGSRKWDVDGNEYVDYFGGHGALILGHNHPAVVEAVTEQLSKGTHYGASHELELEWAELIREMVPCAEKVRFTNSGTEATLLALRLARAHTNKTTVVRFLGNFHGWHDHVVSGFASHEDGSATPGVLESIAENTILLPPGDIEAVRKLLNERNDIAAIILEPTGSTFGKVPITETFLHELREVTIEHEVVLIFDEVISGFRCSRGGAQAYYGVTPDLTTLAKILAGGFPGGALVGNKEIMDWLDHDACVLAGREKISHQGTFNANPVSAAAGIATLEIVAETNVCDRANEYATELRDALRKTLHDENVDWCVYGSFSEFHIFTNPDHESLTEKDLVAPRFDFQKLKAASASELVTKLRLGMLAHGVEILGWPGGPTSSVHCDEDLERTVDAFRQTLRILKEEGDV